MYKYIFSLICLLGVALGASAQGYRYQNVIQGPRGPLANVPVAVCSQPATISSAPCSPLATLYTDSTLITACNGTNGCSNPLTSDGYGNVLFYAAPGKYTIQYYGPQLSAPISYQDIVLPCDPSNCSSTKFENIRFVDGVAYSFTRAGLQQAINDAGASGEVIITPNATITMDSTPISITNPALAINCGAGSAANNQAILLVTNTIADVFDISAGTFSMRGCAINLTGITGNRSGVAVFNASNNTADGMTIENVNVQGSTSHNSGDIFTAYGSSLNYTANWQITQVNISGLWTTGFKIGSTLGTVTQFHINNLVTFANSDFSTAEFLLDSGTDTFQVNGSVLWNGTAGGTAPVILTQNVKGTQTPRLISFQQSSIENHNVANTTFGPGATLTAVQGFEFNASPYIGNTQYVAQLGVNAIGVTFSNNYIQGVQQNCFTLASGSASSIIISNTLQDCGEKTNNTYPAIDVAAGASRLTIINNTFSKFAASNLPSTDVTIETGASDHYLVTTNSLGVSGTDFAGASAVSDGGSGTNKIVTGNIN